MINKITSNPIPVVAFVLLLLPAISLNNTYTSFSIFVISITFIYFLINFLINKFSSRKNRLDI